MDSNDFFQQSFQRNQQIQQQRFERFENQRLISALQMENAELVRTLKNYNTLVEQFYNETKKQNEENAKEMKRLERSKKRLTIVSIVIATLGVIASTLIGIFF